MADPATLAIVGAAAGAMSKKDDPLKGALMGAALGAGGGMLAGGQAASSVIPAGMSGSLPAAQQAAILGVETNALPAWYTLPAEVLYQEGAGQSLAAAQNAAGAKSAISPGMMSAAQGLMRPQEQPMPAPGIRPGRPQMLEKDPMLAMLLGPKLSSQQRISLL